MKGEILICLRYLREERGRKRSLGTGTDITERQAMLLSPRDSGPITKDVSKSPCISKQISFNHVQCIVSPELNFTYIPTEVASLYLCHLDQKSEGMTIRYLHIC